MKKNPHEIELENVERSRNADAQIVCAESLYQEITLRCTTLKRKCDIASAGMGDPQILELSKNVDKFDLELSEILKGVTSLSNFIPTCGEAGKMRDEVTNVKIKFLQNLNDEIVNRDISERKLRNAAWSNINLGKFVGYDSQMDFYTFRTRFRKLIEPTVQRKYWGDILKMNHLGGFALTLVAKIEDINGIWEKLKSHLATLDFFYKIS